MCTIVPHGTIKRGYTASYGNIMRNKNANFRESENTCTRTYIYMLGARGKMCVKIVDDFVARLLYVGWSNVKNPPVSRHAGSLQTIKMIPISIFETKVLSLDFVRRTKDCENVAKTISQRYDVFYGVKSHGANRVACIRRHLDCEVTAEGWAAWLEVEMVVDFYFDDIFHHCSSWLRGSTADSITPAWFSLSLRNLISEYSSQVS